MTLLYATDLTPRCEPGARIAGRLAAALGVPLRLLHVCEDLRAPVLLGTDEEAALGPVRATLAQAAARVASDTGARVRPHLASGDPASAILSLVAHDGAELVLLGASRPRFQPLGALADRVARGCTTPVIALRAAAPWEAWLDRERALEVLVGADTGSASAAALAVALRLAAAGPVSVHVARAIDPAVEHARLGLAPGPAVAEAAVTALERELDAFCQPAPQARRVLLPTNAPAELALLEHARAIGADLIAVGQRRSSRLGQLWYGSVSRAVLHSAPCAVAIAPPSARIDLRAIRPPRAVLVGVVPGPVGERALAWALAVAPAEARLHVVHVLPANTADLAGTLHRVSLQLDALIDAQGPLSRQVVPEIVLGAPADALLAAAARHGAELVVVAARESGPTTWLLGSVARAVSERSAAPVLLVPPAR